MFKRTDSLRRKIITACIIGLGILTIGPWVIETLDNKGVRYNLAKSKVEELAEYDHVEGTSPSEWRSVYKELGLRYDDNPRKLRQKNLDDYLERFGYFWNGREYTNE